jgi:hypothetical protein
VVCTPRPLRIRPPSPSAYSPPTSCTAWQASQCAYKTVSAVSEGTREGLHFQKFLTPTEAVRVILLLQCRCGGSSGSSTLCTKIPHIRCTMPPLPSWQERARQCPNEPLPSPCNCYTPPPPHSSLGISRWFKRLSCSILSSLHDALGAKSV